MLPTTEIQLVAGPKGIPSMQQGRGGMGGRKHGKSGHATQSPRFRLWARREAERTSEIKHPGTKFLASVRELFSKRKPR
jgi:hypothetical protein